MDGANDPAEVPHGDGGAVASLRKAAMGWVLALLVLAGLAAISWPTIKARIRQGAETSAAVNQAGLPLAQAGQAATAQADVTFHPRPATRNYPPCTATRTDSCVQKEKK
jgi:hypothetical protein